MSIAAVAGACSGAARRRPAEPAAAAPAPARPAGPPPAREVLLGEMCPEAVQQRPAVMPLVVRRVVWSDDRDEVERAVSRGEARQFSVLAYDGRRAGTFSVAGAADLGPEADVAVGSYAGASPCAGPAEADGRRREDPECAAAQRGCGLAIAVLEPAGGFAARPYEEAPAPVQLDVGGACLADGLLMVDIDADGDAEAFPAEAFLEALRGPAEEVTAVPRAGSCQPVFARREVIPAGDPRDWLGLDLIGVVDLDGDGRRELVLALRYPDRRTWAVYSARASAARLELVGEALAWRLP